MSDFRDHVARRDDAVATAVEAAAEAAAVNRERIREAVADFLTEIQRLGGKGKRSVPIIEAPDWPYWITKAAWHSKHKPTDNTWVEVGRLSGWALAWTPESRVLGHTAVLDDGRLLTISNKEDSYTIYSWDTLPSLRPDEAKNSIWGDFKLGTADSGLVMACLVETYRICRGS